MKYLIVFFMTLTITYSETVVMGYRTTEIMPLINSKDNEGLYKDLYTEAFNRLGYELEIVRMPKLRAIEGLKDGSIDFYPRFNFTNERSEYIYFIENGLFQKDVLITTADKDEIKDTKDIEYLIFGKNLGAPSYFDEDKVEGLVVKEYAELDLGRSINMLKFGRIDFTIFDYSSLIYYLKSNKITYIKIHEEFIKKKNVMYLGFSKKSKYYKEVENESYSSLKELSIENFPIKLKKGSLPYKLQEVLNEMLLDGTTEELFNKYYN